MRSRSSLLVALITTCFQLTNAAPAPLVAASFDTVSFPTNVLMTSGAAQLGMWVPENGFWYDTSDITCLNMPALTYGACSIATVDRIGVVAGNGPCSFLGDSGFYVTLPGNAGDGLYTVGPPQRIIKATCGTA